MSTRWIEIAISVPTGAAEVLADAVGALTGGVEIRDTETIIRVEGGRSLILAQCAPELEPEVTAEIEAACARLRAAGVSPDPLSIARREADEDEWRDVWKRYFRALRVGKSFVIRPSWDAPPAAAGDRVIDIDPGRAFGTGGHASTRLVIAMAEELSARPVVRFVDLGCGSGILSIAAALLWPAARGQALDVDPEAVATADENLERNRISTVATRVGSIADVAPGNDLVLANIEAAVLVPMAPEFPSRIGPGGTLILSGLLASDVDAVTRAYHAVGFTIDARRDEDEWAALRLSIES
ncbi:MAG TPA: 50S ribosomal protein L11 methyltransferase [Polyangia bacterium]|nr:50S ribosomal protein L11 methyltransferase [Polyangia bacterium]